MPTPDGANKQDAITKVMRSSQALRRPGRCLRASGGAMSASGTLKASAAGFPPFYLGTPLFGTASMVHLFQGVAESEAKS